MDQYGILKVFLSVRVPAVAILRGLLTLEGSKESLQKGETVLAKNDLQEPADLPRAVVDAFGAVE
jgi:hypothetical protein